jgi:hypothetical protein
MNSLILLGLSVFHNLALNLLKFGAAPLRK